MLPLWIKLIALSETNRQCFQWNNFLLVHFCSLSEKRTQKNCLHLNGNRRPFDTKKIVKRVWTHFKLLDSCDMGLFCVYWCFTLKPLSWSWIIVIILDEPEFHAFTHFYEIHIFTQFLLWIHATQLVKELEKTFLEIGKTCRKSGIKEKIQAEMKLQK